MALTLVGYKQRLGKLRGERKLHWLLLALEAFILLAVFPDVTAAIPGVGEFFREFNYGVAQGYEQWIYDANIAEVMIWIGDSIADLVWPGVVFACIVPVSLVINAVQIACTKRKIKKLNDEENGITAEKKKASKGARGGFSALLPVRRVISAHLRLVRLKLRAAGDNAMYERSYLRVQKLAHGDNDRDSERILNWSAEGTAYLECDVDDTSDLKICFYLKDGKAYVESEPPRELRREEPLILRKNDRDREDRSADILLYAVTWFGGTKNGKSR